MPAHRRLAGYWRLDETGADLVRRCLVLIADHELNASTFVGALRRLDRRDRCARSCRPRSAPCRAAPRRRRGPRRGDVSRRDGERRPDHGGGGAARAAAKSCPASASRSIPRATRAPSRSSMRCRLTVARSVTRRLVAPDRHPNVDFALGGGRDGAGPAAGRRAWRCLSSAAPSAGSPMRSSNTKAAS